MPGYGVIRALDRWWFAPAPAQRLAGLRILVGTYAVVWSLVRLPAHLGHTGQPGHRWQPVGLLAPFGDPLPDVVVIGLAVGTPILGLLYTVGWRYPLTGPSFGLALLAVSTLDSSWGQIFHTENLMVLHVVILGVAPAADVFALSRRVGPPSRPHGRYGWPVRLAMAVVVLAYLLAGIAKLRTSGFGWMGGDVLRNLVAHDNLRKEVLGDVYSPLGAALVAHGWLFPPMAVATVAVEFGAVVALLGGRWRTIWVAAAWVFHLGVLALMAILFPYQLSGVAFAPFFRVERTRPARWLAVRLARPASPSNSPGPAEPSG